MLAALLIVSNNQPDVPVATAVAVTTAEPTEEATAETTPELVIRADDRDGDGVLDGDDACPDEAGVPEEAGCPAKAEPPTVPPPADSDGDGVPDDTDQCPNEAGDAANNGCLPPAPPADRDGDGVPDDTDQCPDAAGDPTNNGCALPVPPVAPADSDGDGVPDDTDQCPNEAGDAANNGCPSGGAPVPPPPPPPPPPADSDGDGVNDADDQCPGTPGGAQVFSNGCPVDNDGDTVPDGVDRCPDTPAGSQVYGDGCINPNLNDADRDGVVDANDQCPDVAGDPTNNGCAAPTTVPTPVDRDGDGVPDDADQCPDVAGDPTNNGCALPVPPVAQVTPQNTAGWDAQSTDLTVAFTSRTSGSAPTAYAWNFGDGRTSAEANPTHTYAQAGAYTVTLTVTFADGSAVSSEQQVTVNAPAVTATCEVLTIVQDTAAPQFTFGFTARGQNITAYNWNFGDGGTGSGPIVSHRYAAAGNYSYTLSCVTADGQTITLNGSVNITEKPPVSGIVISAAFTTNRASGPENFVLQLTNYTTVNPASTALSYAWQVTGPGGYNQTSSATNPSFTLGGVGVYAITLTVSGGGETATATGTVEVVASAPKPQVSITAQPRSGPGPLTVTLTANLSGGPVDRYEWDFGNGSASAEAGPHTQTYTEAGRTYTITLRVSGPGGEAFATTTVVVLAQGAEVRASFTSERGAEANGRITYCFVNTTPGTYSQALWDFGDGTTLSSMESQVCHDYAPGTYVVDLEVTTPDGAKSSAQEQIQPVVGVRPPTVEIIASDTTVNVGETVSFSARTTGAIRTYEWNFGEFGTSSAANPTITFNRAGTFTANLRVTGPGGSAEAAAVNVEVSFRQMSCTMSGSTSAPFNGRQTYTLNVTNPDNRALTYEWTVNGQPAGTNRSVEVSFPSAGTTSIVGRAFVDGVSLCEISRDVTVTLQTLNCAIGGTTSPLLNASVEYQITANNLNGRRFVSWAWTLTRTSDNAVVAEGSSQRLSYRFTEPGVSYSLVAQATTDSGDACTRTITIVTRDSDLSCSIDGNRTASLFDRRTYTARIQGGTGTTSYRWFVNDVEQSSAARTLDVLFERTGSYTIAVEITRGSSTCRPTLAVNVGEGSGGSNITCRAEATPASALPGQDVTLNVNVGNLRGRTASYTWSIAQDSSFSATTRATRYTTTTSGTYTATVRVTTEPESPPCEASVSWTVTTEQARCEAQFVSPINPFASSQASVAVTQFVTANPVINWTINGQPAGTGPSVTYPADLVNQPNSSFSVAYSVSDGTTEFCSGSFNVAVGADALACAISGPASVAIGEPATFTVNVSNANGRQMDFAWTVNGEPVGSGSSITTTYTGRPGQLIVSVVGTGTNASCAASAEFAASAGQSISASASPNAGLVPLTVTFTADTTNIDRSTLVWEYPDGSREQAETGTYQFTEPGEYTVTVTGVGPIRTQSASVVVRTATGSGLVASFRADPWQAVAPYTICFTDLSTTDSAPINTWNWSFPGGSPATSTEQNPCVTYSLPGQYDVTLNVSNGVLNGRALNKVRLYALTDGSASFGVDVRGSGEVCFSAAVSDNISVTGWDFGDGTTGPGQNEICHTYTQNRTYEVTMTFARGELTGSVKNFATVDSGTSQQQPDLRLAGVCASDGTATFSLTNFGGAMTSQGTVSASGSVSGALTPAPTAFQLAGGASASVTVKGIPGETITLTTDASAGSVSRSVDCAAPRLEAVGYCTADGGASFTIYNPSSVAITGTVNITTDGEPRADAEVNIPAGGSQTVTANLGYTTYTLAGLSLQPPTVGLESTITCDEPEGEQLLVVSQCWEDGTTHRFLLINPGDEAVSVGYNDVSGEQVAELPPQGSREVFVSGTYGQTLVFTVFYGRESIVEVPANLVACKPAYLALSGACTAAGQASFSIANPGSVALSGVEYAVSYVPQGEVQSPADILDSGVADIAAGGSATLTYDGQSGQTLYLSVPSRELALSVECEPGDEQPTPPPPTQPTPPPTTPETPSATPTPAQPASTPAASATPGDALCGADMVRYDAAGSLIVGMDTAGCVAGPEGELAGWSPIRVGEGQCVDWVAYHTNLTGDLEIFRLGELPAELGFNPDADVNLSKGYGARVNDLSPTRSPDSRWLAFASDRDGDMEIFVTPVDGTLEDVRQLTINSGIDLQPAWSPNGRYIAYATTTYAGQTFEIAMIDLETGAKMRLTNNAVQDFNPFWSPDSTRILYTSQSASGDYGLYELNLEDLKAITTTEILPGDANREFLNGAYAPDGRSIVYRVVSGSSSVISLLNLETGEVTAVTESGFSQNMVFSADGSLLAYQSNQAGTDDIYVYEVATGVTRLVTSNTGDAAGRIDIAPTWICDSTTLVFTSDATAQNPLDNNIFSVDALPIDAPPVDVATQARQLTSDTANDQKPQNVPSLESGTRDRTPQKGRQG
jgi:PKD repeat protein